MWYFLRCMHSFCLLLLVLRETENTLLKMTFCLVQDVLYQLKHEIKLLAVHLLPQ